MFKDREEKIFNYLNSKLCDINQNLEIICAGGYILDRYELRSTEDIDAFYITNDKIENAIREVGEKFKINPKNELWLNNSIQDLNMKPPLDICESIYEFSNLKVMIPPLDYVVCMKLKSAREQDIKDVSNLIIKLDIPSPEEMKQIINKYNFTMIDESVILESFGNAYGLDWLENYYINNIETTYNNC